MIKQIEGMDGYFASSDGKILCNLGRGRRDRSKRVDMYQIKGRPTYDGYLRVYIRDQQTGKRKDYYIHRLIAKTFIDQPYGKNYVNHINCNRTDNRVENLEWCTAKENTDYTMLMKHAFRGPDGRYQSVNSNVCIV